MKITRILLVDDHKVFLEGLGALFEKAHGFEVVGEAHNGEDAVSMVRDLNPDLVLMDVDMPKLSGLEACTRIQKETDPPHIIILSNMDDTRHISQAFEIGVGGFLLKSSLFHEILAAVGVVQGGGRYLSGSLSARYFEHFLQMRPDLRHPGASSLLTEREQNVLSRIADGDTVKSIAAELGLSPKTIEVHRLRIMRKLGVDNIAALTKYALRHGFTNL